MNAPAKSRKLGMHKITSIALSGHNPCLFNNRDTMPCCDICKGLFFFFYLPTLPLWWTMEFVWGFVKRKRQRHKRKKRYRAVKATQAEKEKECYLSVDQYTRGKVEKQILGISKKNKAKKTQQKNKGTHMHTHMHTCTRTHTHTCTCAHTHTHTTHTTHTH